MSYDNLPGDARTLLLRSAALAGGILAVAAATIWLLINRFVARPLRAYASTAPQIAAGRNTAMPDLGLEEFGELGRTIDAMAEELRGQASLDALTGLKNVRDLQEALPLLEEEASASGQSLALIVADLNDLKPVNDGYGHQAGDVVLRRVATEIPGWLASSGTCWRTGGDEFLIALPRQSTLMAEAKAKSLDEATRSLLIELPEGSVRVSISVGAASYPEDGASANQVLQVADRRMYAAKADHRENGLAQAG